MFARIYTPFGGVILLIIFILAILAIVDIIKRNMSIEKKLIWIILILLLPLLGVILYYLLGRD